MSQLVVATYAEGSAAAAALRIQSDRGAELVRLQAAIVVTRDGVGDVTVGATALGPAQALAPRRAAWGLLSALVFFTPRLWPLIAGFIERSGGRSADVGLDESATEAVRADLAAGGSAVMAIVAGESARREREILAETGGSLHALPMSHAAIGSIAEAFEYPEVYAIASLALSSSDQA